MAVKGINGADLNNISKVDGRSNVLDKVNGVDADLSPPAVAYSVRNVSSLTGIPYDGPAMRILVDATGDGADATDLEFDINFTADGDLDVADIELKCAGGKDAYVVKWYDQSGAGNDATQTAYASMPKIATAGVVITDNGKPAIYAIESGTRMNFVQQDIADASVLLVSRTTVSATNEYPLNQDLSSRYRLRYFSGRFYLYITGTTITGPVISANTRTLHSFYDSGSTVYWRTDGGNEITSAFTGSTSHDRIVGSLASGMKFQEYILFDSNKYDNRTDIENNINSYFNIYQSRENILPGAAVAYSLRQLSDSSRLAVRVRRDTGVGSGTDDDEADVGFDANGELSLASPVSNFDPTGSAATTLGGFLGHGGIYGDPDSLGTPADGFVTVWYDQSANANNATQATPASQPQIYDSSTGLITENGKPALDTLTIGKFTITQLDVVSAFYVARTTTLNYANFVLADATSGFTMPGSNSTFGQIGFKGSNTVFGTNYQNDLNQHLVSAVATASATVYVDGVSEASGTASSVSVDALFDGRSASGINFEGKAQEIVLWITDQSTNRSAIEGNQNAHYGIANFGTPSSGLLADYPGSAAAYSVRKLADTAGLAMRIIVDDTAVIGTVDASDTEYDIGFDANGDLDVARIREVCNNPSGANYNAYVVTWYDQSGNGNHATQATYANCPQIYDGVDVIMENGKPALERNSNGSIHMSTPSIGSSSTATMFTTVTPRLTRSIIYQSSGYIASEQSGGLSMYYGSFISGTASTLQQRIQTYTIGTTDVGYINGVQNVSGNAGGANTGGAGNIGGQAANFRDPQKMQEIVIYLNDDYADTTNRKAIETDIDSYYRIYGDPDDGLLSTPYGKGAAAAYSVRQLSNKATRAMRILVDADANGPDASDNEYDIGFDANGELDIARIEELCDKGTGNYNAYVTTWYDQSGEGNDATQATHANMPKICNAGTVILENGRPAVDFDGDNLFKASPSGFSGLAQSFFFVGSAENNSSDNRFVSLGTHLTGQARGFSSEYYMRFVGSVKNYSAYAETNTQRLHAIVCPGTISDISAYDWYRDGSLMTASATSAVNNIGSGNLAIGSDHRTVGSFSGKMQEVVIYNNDQDSNRTLIESNINDYFNIEGV